MLALFFFIFRCCEKESLDGTLRRIIAQKDTNIQKSGGNSNNNFGGGQGLWASLKLLRGDVKQVCNNCGCFNYYILYYLLQTLFCVLLNYIYIYIFFSYKKK